MRRMLVVVLSMVLVVGMTGMVLADNNNVDIEQWVNDSEAYVTQKGSGNDGFVIQESWGYRKSGIPANDPMFSDIFQSGNNNEADIYQYMDGGLMSAWITQKNGSFNTADIDQFKQYGMDGIASVLQKNGNWNEATVDQQQGNKAIVKQNGTGNISDVLQIGYGSNGKVWTIQQGDYNQDYYTENDVYSSIGRMEQYGSYNIANITQDGREGESHDELNTAKVYQYNNYNETTIDQTGSNNFVKVTQNGTWNYSELIQLGLNNRITVEQLDNSSDAFVEQEGNGNIADVNQSN